MHSDTPFVAAGISSKGPDQWAKRQVWCINKDTDTKIERHTDRETDTHEHTQTHTDTHINTHRDPCTILHTGCPALSSGSSC